MGLREALWLLRHPLSSPPMSVEEAAAEERENNELGFDVEGEQVPLHLPVGENTIETG